MVTEQRSSVLKLILTLSVNLVKLEKKACCVCVPDQGAEPTEFTRISAAALVLFLAF